MAKKLYNIPYSLDSSYMDMEITVTFDSTGLGVRPFPLRNIFFVIVGAAFLMIALTKTFVAHGTFMQKVAFSILWILLCVLLLTIDKTKTLGIEKIPTFISFLNKSSRSINTRSHVPASEFIMLTGIKDITEYEGAALIHYIDGSLGILFDVIGNASILLFDSHKNAILDRVDRHFRNVSPDITYHFITRKEPQNVELQARSMNDKMKNMESDDPELRAMMETHEVILEKIVGEKHKSLHQYLLVQALNEEQMRVAVNILRAETENSSLMFKHIEALPVNKVLSFLTGIYGERKEI